MARFLRRAPYRPPQGRIALAIYVSREEGGLARDTRDSRWMRGLFVHRAGMRLRQRVQRSRPPAYQRDPCPETLRLAVIRLPAELLLAVSRVCSRYPSGPGYHRRGRVVPYAVAQLPQSCTSPFPSDSQGYPKQRLARLSNIHLTGPIGLAVSVPQNSTSRFFFLVAILHLPTTCGLTTIPPPLPPSTILLLPTSSPFLLSRSSPLPISNPDSLPRPRYPVPPMRPP